MRELKQTEAALVSGGWDNTHNPTDPQNPGNPMDDPYGNPFGSPWGSFDGSEDTDTVETSGGSNGIDSVTVTVDTDGDGEPDLRGTLAGDSWDVEYTFDNGNTIGASTSVDGGTNTPGHTGGIFVTGTVRF